MKFWVRFSQVFVRTQWGDWLPSMHNRSNDQGVCLRVCGGGLPPEGSLHLGGVGLHPGGGVCIKLLGILRDTVNKQAVRILLECFLVKRCQRQLQAPTIKIFNSSYLDIEACRTVYVPHSHLNFFLFREFANAKRI